MAVLKGTEAWHNLRKRHPALGRIAPTKFERISGHAFVRAGRGEQGYPTGNSHLGTSCCPGD
jgi:hypothetical protein